jgi:hypothetical protein
MLQYENDKVSGVGVVLQDMVVVQDALALKFRTILDGLEVMRSVGVRTGR